MVYSPKENEQKMARMINAWDSLAPNKSFGGLTLADFRAVAKPAQDARQEIDDLEAQLTRAHAKRDAADAAFAAKAQLVVNGVLADPTEGADSPLYAEMGYTRKSDRHSGLTRKGNKTTDKPNEK
jgi:hypothetical protein